MLPLITYPYITSLCHPTKWIARLYITILLIAASTQKALPQKDDYSLSWDSPSENAASSMPCGGGDIGLNIWVEKGDILFYMARSGTFDENNTMLKLGRIRIHLTPNPFANAKKFTQRLDLRNGNCTINATVNGISAQINIWVDVSQPVIHCQVRSSRPVITEATYESWRYRDRVILGKANNGNSYKWAPQHAPGGKVITKKDSIAFEGNDLVFFHHNTSPTVFDVAVHEQGLDTIKDQLTNPLAGRTFGGLIHGRNMRSDGTSSGTYADTDFKGWMLRSTTAARQQDIEIYCHTDNFADWQKNLRISARTAQNQEARNRAWWHDFWDRSFIHLTGDQWQAGRNYQLFRYMMGCNASGSYPTKFNGGLFTVDPSLTDTAMRFTPDFRLWGGGTFTAQNQRLVYWPLIKTGDTDLLRSQLDFYADLLHNAELRTRAYWHHDGASFTEQIENYGLPNPAEYGFNMPADHDKGVEYNAWLEYEWDTSLEFCLMMLETERYYGCNIKPYVPLIGSCLRFFNQHYQQIARQQGRQVYDSAGKLALYPGSAAETYKMAYNSSSTIAGLQTVLQRALELPKTYTSDTLRKEWTEMLRHIPPISFRNWQGHPTISPALTWQRINNTETPQLYPLFPWGVYGLTKPGLDTALNTWKYDSDVVKLRGFKGWRQDNIFAARLGLKDEAAQLTMQKLQDGPHRFPAFWGPGYDWTPDHNWGGSAMIGLQEMLIQSDGKKIILFPAWPMEWNVHFKLHVPYNTTVEAELKGGKLTMLHITPEERKKDLISKF